ncbi:hypothetical protein SDC9_111309 [bioreactor metagenome]|uniref:Uncharacterized protein n=1 Tax=bioreactor metagenome TaxID=1076179 RepID=A0A645BMB4_9ZZZZ
MGADDGAVVGHGTVGAHYQTFQLGDDIARFDASFIGGGTRCHRSYPDAVDRTIIVGDNATVDADGFKVLALKQGGDYLSGSFFADGEVLVGIGTASKVNTNDLAIVCYQRSTRVSGVTGGVMAQNTTADGCP